jgi:dTDP-glucose 4,6-dehydratase
VTTVLLTGAGGFAGHHCLQHVLVNTDWDVIVVDSFRHKGKTDRITQVTASHPDWPDRVTVVTHDLTVPFSNQMTAALMKRDGIDYVLAYASDSDVYKSITDPVPTGVNNFGVALATLELCRKLHPRAVVWVSTDEVYGPVTEPDTLFAEWSPIVPSNPYAASKAAQEAMCSAYWRTYGVPVIILNVMNMFGERQQVEKFTPMVMRAVLRGDELTIHGQPGNVGSRRWLHARNLADAILFLLRTPPARYPEALWPARYNVSSPDRVDNLTLAETVAGIMGRPLRFRYSDPDTERPGHDLHYGLDQEKLGSLSWKPPVPFGESLERTVRWTMNNLEWLED